MAETRILVVEDEVIPAWDIQVQLKNLGYTAAGWASSGEDAIDQADQIRPDLVLMDIKLKGKMDGVEAAEQIQTQLDIPIVYLTAYADEATMQRAKITAPYGYLLKPFDARELHIAIEIALYRHHMEQKLKDREQLREALSRIQSRFISDGDTGPRFVEMLQVLLDLTGSRAGFIGEVLYTPEEKPSLRTRALKGVTWPEATRTFDSQAANEALEFYGLNNLFETVMTTGQAVITNDPASDSLQSGPPPEHPPLTAFLGIPFYHGQELVGVVAIANRPGGYDQALVDWLEPILSTCASMIVADRNERLRKQVEQEIFYRNRELTVLNRIITASTTSSEPKEILSTACRELAQAFDAPRAIAFLLDEEKVAATVVAEYQAENQSVPGLPLPLAHETLLQPLMRHKMPLLIDETHDNPSLTPTLEVMRCSGLVWLLHLPLVVKEQLLGSLYLEASQAHDFSPEEINLARRVAEQVSGALARAQLMQAQQLLTTIIEQATESVVITDTERIVVYVNPAFERVTGYSRAEAVGQTTFLLESGRHSQAFEDELWDTIRSGQVWHGRLINKKKDSTLFTEDATITPVRDTRGNIVNFVSVRRDVTRELELEEQYRQAQKMEAVGLLAGGIAHDFNNMLTAINGYAGLLQLQLSEDKQAQEMIQTILRAGQRSAELVRQLLIFSRRQVVEPRVLSLNTVVYDLKKMMGRIIGEHIDIITNLAEDLWPIKADPTQIEQIILNLAVNAQDAMPDGGQLLIETANVILDENYIASHLAVQPGEFSALIISDTGVGMSKEIQARIFEPFFTTKEMGRGTGLGLATVYGIVKQNGGSIWVYSEEGQGTTFKIYLPRITEAVDFPGHNAGADELPQGTETILVVEDEPAVRTLTEQVLNRQGYRVLTAARGQEALSLAQEYPQQIQLLLTDIVMPGMSGKALAEKLAQRHPGLKVIFMSGYSDSMIARHGVLEQGHIFIQKPFSLRMLVHKVREVLE